MTYVIFGAGAIGGTIGAYMIRGGEDVLFVDSAQEHVDAINARGLTIQGYAETFNVRARAVTPDRLPDGLTRVVLATKAPATLAAVRTIAPHLAPDGYIMSAQNGLNEVVISDVVGAERTIGCFVNFSADYIEPGLIHFGGPGAFFIGELDGAETPRLAELQRALSHWGGGPVRITDNIWGYLWGKLGYGAMLFATALSNDTMADGIDRYRTLMAALANEVLAVARAEGRSPIGFDGYDTQVLESGQAAPLDAMFDRLVEIRRRDKKTHSGVWRDLAVRRRRTEIDAQYMPVLSAAAKHGIATPLLTRLIGLIHEIEGGRRALAEDNLDALNEAYLCSRVSREELWRTNSVIAGWIRLSGTHDERAAFDFCRSEMDKAGLRTTLLEHPALVSWPLEAALTVSSGSGTQAAVTCLGTAFSTGADIDGEVVDVGFGDDEDYAAHDVRGRIVLVNGLATPGGVRRAELAGAIGQIFINDAHLHNMIVSPVWGTPTPESAPMLPRTPSVSVTEADGHALRARAGVATIRARLVTSVFKGWQRTPILIGELEPAGGADDFVLFSGHLDSWEYGAMDNGSANATMLEVARLLGPQRHLLRRGVRFAMWSGHSHGRYSGSTWYADNHWEELHDRCVAHVNIDSTGARGATYYASFPAHAELSRFAAGRIFEHTGQTAQSHPMPRAGDMSFNGIGIPAMFMSLSQVPYSGQSDYVSIEQGRLFGGMMPWWWHTVDDTIDKVDLDVLALDTRVYVSALWQLSRRRILPMDFRPVAAELQRTLQALQAAASGHVDFGDLLDRARGLQEGIESLMAAAEAPDADPTAINAAFKALSRALIPITYTATGRFDHDPALGAPLLPSLQAARELARQDPAGDDYGFLRARLRRNANAIAFALRQAIDAAKL